MKFPSWRWSVHHQNRDDVLMARSLVFLLSDLQNEKKSATNHKIFLTYISVVLQCFTTVKSYNILSFLFLLQCCGGALSTLSQSTVRMVDPAMLQRIQIRLLKHNHHILGETSLRTSRGHNYTSASVIEHCCNVAWPWCRLGHLRFIVSCNFTSSCLFRFLINLHLARVSSSALAIACSWMDRLPT